MNKCDLQGKPGVKMAWLMAALALAVAVMAAVKVVRHLASDQSEATPPGFDSHQEP